MKIRRSVVISAIMGLITITAITVSLSASNSPSQSAKKPPVVDLYFTGPDGKPLADDKVTLGNGFNYLPRAHFADGLGGVPSDELKERTIEDAMKHVENLEKWQLCGAELSAVTADMKARAANILHFPRDLPFNKNDEGVQAQDIAWAMRDYDQYDRAARDATKARISCTNEQPNDLAHTITFQVVVDGKTRPLVIPEYKVVSTPVEYNLLVGNCADILRKKLEELKVRPLDTVVQKGPPWSTFSERRKANSVSWLNIQIDMMAKLGYEHCTRPVPTSSGPATPTV
jgi:hypothetical protein